LPKFVMIFVSNYYVVASLDEHDARFYLYWDYFVFTVIYVQKGSPCFEKNNGAMSLDWQVFCLCCKFQWGIREKCTDCLVVNVKNKKEGCNDFNYLD